MTNSPDSKAKGQGSGDGDSEEKPDVLLFFNYHEYLVNNFQPLGTLSGTTNESDESIVVNHFPNIHVSTDSSTYASTRLIRIPRTYDSLAVSDMVPQFSNYIPGQEPASISVGSQITYTPKGQYDDNVFSQTSLTPLVPDLLTEAELSTIVTTVNAYLLDAYNPYNINNVIDGILEFFTGGLYSRALDFANIHPYTKRKLLQLDTYIEHEVNQKLFADRDTIKVYSPKLSGYLSLDIQIPKPVTAISSE